MKCIYISIIFCCALSIGCVTHTYNDETKIVHVVLLWLKEPNNEEHIRNVITATKELEQIPEIQELQVGKSIPSDRPIVDDSFDVGLTMIFDSQQSLERYLVHPKHKAAVKSVLRPLTSKILVYDFQQIAQH